MHSSCIALDYSVVMVAAPLRMDNTFYLQNPRPLSHGLAIPVSMYKAFGVLSIRPLNYEGGSPSVHG